MKQWKLAVLWTLLLALLAGCASGSGAGATPKTLEAEAEQARCRVKVMRMYENAALVVDWGENESALDLNMGLDYVTGTWEELCDQGYIDKENLYWDNGVFLSIELTEEGARKFTFTAEKWRGGLGAIFYTGCAAKPGRSGQWSYEPGGFAIS